MPEPARSFPLDEDDTADERSPLRDWLSTMRLCVEPAAQVTAQVAQVTQVAEISATAWGPRLVRDEPDPQPEDAADISELMAENLMLKARLRVEFDRQDDLQNALADQIRELQEHISQEMASLEGLRAEQMAAQVEHEEFRAERDHLRHDREVACEERDRIAAECDALRAEQEALVNERDLLRAERDLWRARAEALAQPLFQVETR